MTAPTLVHGGYVGVQRDGEKVCPSCNGAGRMPGDGPMGGCDRCSGTGIVTALKVGDKVPLPKEKLKVYPSRNADHPAPSPRGVFRNGRGGAS